MALQIGGAEPGELADCARIAADYGYDEVNLNVGCPSDRVQKARFGACLMADPALVGACVAAMATAARIPVTVKCRIGIDQRDSFADLCNFTKIVADSGCRALIVHARKAWLAGLSPKQNREIPPLRPEVVYRPFAGIHYPEGCCRQVWLWSDRCFRHKVGQWTRDEPATCLCVVIVVGVLLVWAAALRWLS